MFTKKVFYSIVVVVGLVVLSSQISFGAEQFSRDLYFGIQQDSDVTNLQEFLSDEGLYSGPITGNFFSLTLKAVKAFQSREGITPVAGYFGPKTRVRANALLGAQVQASNQQAVAETGQNITQSSTSQNINNFTSNVQLQLEALLNQVVLLQQQLQAQQQNQNSAYSAEILEITSVNITPDKASVKIEWQTSKPTESKVFISGGNFLSKTFLSESGFSSNHVANISSLSPTTNYSYEITAINELGFTRKSGTFTTLNAFISDISVDKEEIKNDGIDFATVSIITKLTNGEILQNKSLKMKTNIYGSGGTVTSFDESKSSDNEGIIIFKTRPTSYYDGCGMGMTITIIDNENSRILYSQNIKIINIKTVSPVGKCA